MKASFVPMSGGRAEVTSFLLLRPPLGDFSSERGILLQRKHRGSLQELKRCRDARLARGAEACGHL